MSIPGVMEASRLGSFDTSGEQSNTIMPGLQHKYKETALILSTNRCAMYCRHCFRKRLVGISEEAVFSRLFGTRMPVVLPQRITTDPELLHLLRKYGTRKQLCVVT